MGRRAKKAPVVTKKRHKLAKLFKCPFCNNEAAVECKMDFKNEKGTLTCRLCPASFQMDINNLSEPVDVHSEWLDDCARAARGEVEEVRAPRNDRNDDNNLSIDLGAEDSDDDEEDE